MEHYFSSIQREKWFFDLKKTNKNELSYCFFSRGKIYKTLQLPTRFGSAVAFGACDSGYNRLYVLTGQTDFNILTGSPTNITVPSPGGSLIVLTDVGKGTKVSKPCIGC